MTETGSSDQLQLPKKPIKQKMASSLKSLGSWVLGGGGGGGAAPIGKLFAKTDPAKDGEECLHDCDSCTVRYPRGFKIEENDVMYGEVKGWSTQLLVGTGKTDWVREVSDEKGSVMEAVDKAQSPSNGVSDTRLDCFGPSECELESRVEGRAISWDATIHTDNQELTGDITEVDAIGIEPTYAPRHHRLQ